ncbi:MAG: hypothetical protein ABIR55_23005 [Burkholderiaceae bacterium]
MAYLVGLLLALLLFAIAAAVRLDRERAFYPTVLMTIALYYVLFGVIGGETRVLMIEVGVASVFLLTAIAGFKWSAWLIVAGMAGHGLFDSVHGALYVDRGVPLWWPAFCGTFDITAALVLAALLLRRRGSGASDVGKAGRI